MLGADFVILDGYNVINSWPELHKLQGESLEDARQKLEDYMASYSSFKGFKIIIVYDGQGKGSFAWPEEEVIHKNLSVVFTTEGITADSYIERRVYEILRRRKAVFVVTGDYSEQLNVLGAGAFRFSVRELRGDFQRAQEEFKHRGGVEPEGGRNELERRLDARILEKLEELRRGQSS